MGDSDIVTRAKELVEQADGESVDVNKLTNGEGSFMGIEIFNEPLISYLIEDEQPHHMFTAPKIKIKGLESIRSSCLPNKGLMVFSDMRILIVLYQDMTDDIISIPLSSINSVDYDKGGLLQVPKLTIYTDKHRYKIVTSKNISHETIEPIINSDGVNQSRVEEVYQIGKSEPNFVCSKCRESVNSDAQKCPHCGYYPGKGGKGGLWNATALATAWTPIGMGMLAKSAADEARTRRGIAEEVEATDANDDAQAGSEDSFEKLERLSELKEQGVLSDEEFQKKKEEILDQI